MAPEGLSEGHDTWRELAHLFHSATGVSPVYRPRHTPGRAGSPTGNAMAWAHPYPNAAAAPPLALTLNSSACSGMPTGAELQNSTCSLSGVQPTTFAWSAPKYVSRSALRSREGRRGVPPEPGAQTQAVDRKNTSSSENVVTPRP